MEKYKTPIYLDTGATTPARAEVVKAMLPYFSEKYGNPSSLHRFGREALLAVEEARLTIANILNADPKEIYFTGSTTEADNLALWGALSASKKATKPHLIICPLEHHAVLNSAKQLARQGKAELTILPVDKTGLVSPREVANALRPETALVSVMTVSNEIGTIQPIAEIAKAIKEAGSSALFHTDNASGAEYLPLDVEKLSVDMMVLGPHKFGGPKGMGILYLREGVRISPLIYGGLQEKGLRPGTRNVPGIIGSAKALELAEAEKETASRETRELANYLIERLKTIPDSYLTGHPVKRAPHIVSFVFKGAEGEAMVLKLSDLNIMVSSGSACASGTLEPSHVLLACGIPAEEAHGSLRFSLSPKVTKEELDFVAQAVAFVVKELREMNPLYQEE